MSVRMRSLLFVPPAFAVAFGVAALVAGREALALENEAGKLLALAGCLAAAVAFERGDYLRRAWFISGLCFLLLLVGDALGAPALAASLGPARTDLAQGVLALVANATSVVGTWMLARAWTVAGIEEDDGGASRARGRIIFAAAVVVALAVTGWPLAQDLRALAGGDASSLVSIASDLGDTICFALVAPLLQTALAMRGGALWWPWGLLTAGGVAWILYDAATGVGQIARVEPGPWAILTEALRALACSTMFAAGLAQRMVVTRVASAQHAD